MFHCIIGPRKTTSRNHVVYEGYMNWKVSIYRFETRLTQRVPLLEQEMLIRNTWVHPQFLVRFVLLDLYYYVHVLEIVVCPFALFLLTIVLAVRLRFTNSDYLLLISSSYSYAVYSCESWSQFCHSFWYLLNFHPCSHSYVYFCLNLQFLRKSRWSTKKGSIITTDYQRFVFLKHWVKYH